MSRTDSREQDKPGARSARAAEIRRTAARIFHEKGYDATSIQDIADAVGILKGSLYYYIDTKEDLLFEVIKAAHEKGVRDVAAWRDTTAPPAMKLRAAIEGHVTSNLENIAEVGVFFQDFRSLSPERRAEIVKDRDFYDRNLLELVEQGQEAGEFNADLDPKMAVMAMLGMMNWVYQWYRPDGPLSPREIASAFADLLLGGLANRGDAPSASEIGQAPDDAAPPRDEASA